MYRKLRYWLRIAVYVSVIFASWTFGLNQLGQALKVNRMLAERQAIEFCMDFEVPHAVIVDGKIYCHALYQGTTVVVPLERLQQPKTE